MHVYRIMMNIYTVRFNCGHWFARSEEDGSVERFLVGKKVPQTIAKSGAMSALSKDYC